MYIVKTITVPAAGQLEEIGIEGFAVIPFLDTFDTFGDEPKIIFQDPGEIKQELFPQFTYTHRKSAQFRRFFIEGTAASAGTTINLFISDICPAGGGSVNGNLATAAILGGDGQLAREGVSKAIDSGVLDLAASTSHDEFIFGGSGPLFSTTELRSFVRINHMVARIDNNSGASQTLQVRFVINFLNITGGTDSINIVRGTASVPTGTTRWGITLENPANGGLGVYELVQYPNGEGDVAALDDLNNSNLWKFPTVQNNPGIKAMRFRVGFVAANAGEMRYHLSATTLD